MVINVMFKRDGKNRMIFPFNYVTDYMCEFDFL